MRCRKTLCNGKMHLLIYFSSIQGLAPLVGDENILENEQKLSAMIDQLQKLKEQIFSNRSSSTIMNAASNNAPSSQLLPSPPQQHHHQHSTKVSTTHICTEL